MGGPTTSRDRVPDGGEAEDAGPRPEALATADSGTEPLLPIAWRMKNRPGEVRVLADSYTNVSVSSSGKCVPAALRRRVRCSFLDPPSLLLRRLCA